MTEVVRWTRIDLKDVAIPEFAQTFLVNQGLPVLLHKKIQWDSGAPCRHQIAPNLRRIGLSEMGNWFCLDEDHEGRVVHIQIRSFKVRFVNSSVIFLSEFLWRYQEFQLIAFNSAPRTCRRFLTQMQASCRELDPLAFGDQSSYWAEIFDDHLSP